MFAYLLSTAAISSSVKLYRAYTSLWIRVSSLLMSAVGLTDTGDYFLLFDRNVRDLQLLGQFHSQDYDRLRTRLPSYRRPFGVDGSGVGECYSGRDVKPAAPLVGGGRLRHWSAGQLSVLLGFLVVSHVVMDPRTQSVRFGVVSWVQLWVVNCTSAAPWFQPVVPETVAKS